MVGPAGPLAICSLDKDLLRAAVGAGLSFFKL